MRVSWDPHMEKTLVELLHEHNNSTYRGENGWSSEAWNKIVKEFHEMERHVNFTRAQVQEKEKELKRDYKMLKEARKQSGVHWNQERDMIEAEPAIWQNIIISCSKAKKFKTKSFPLFEALGELYDGHIAEGTYNFTSSDPPKYPLIRQIENRDEEKEEDAFPNFEETFAHHEQDDANSQVQRNEDEYATVERNGERLQRRDATVSTNQEEKEPKKAKKSDRIEGMMERYLEMRTKQDEAEAVKLAKEKEDEAARLAKEKEDEAARLASDKPVGQGNDFSIKRCISVLNLMELTKVEKAKAYSLFRNAGNREIFLSASDEDPETAMIWLRNEMA